MNFRCHGLSSQSSQLRTTTFSGQRWTLLQMMSRLCLRTDSHTKFLVGNSFVPVAVGQRAQTVLPFAAPRRDGLGATHHEAGTLACGDNPAQSVTDADMRFHEVTNLYATGPAVFPTVGSPNPMLTGTALARRLRINWRSLRPWRPIPASQCSSMELRSPVGQ